MANAPLPAFDQITSGNDTKEVPKPMDFLPFDAQCAQMQKSLVGIILACKSADVPLVVGISGIDGSGKTTLAAALEQALQCRNHDVCRISVDDFHRPRAERYQKGELSPQAFYHDSIDFSTLADKSLRPVSSPSAYPIRCQTKSFDILLDKPDLQYREIYKHTIIVIEGVFLFRPEIARYIHLKVFLQVSFDQVLQRVILRDEEKIGSVAAVRMRYEQKYFPGQRLYLNEVVPQDLADIVIDNNDVQKPVILRSGLV